MARTRRRSGWMASPMTPLTLGVITGAVASIGVFLPWYAANLGEPTVANSVSGWTSTGMAKAVFALAVLWLLASVALVADEWGWVAIDRRTAEALGWFVAAAALAVGFLVAYRLFRPPPPADFLTREWGLFVALATAALGVASGVGMATRR